MNGSATFDSHNQDSELNKRTGKQVTILRELTNEEYDIDDVGKMYHVQFPDGLERDVFSDELLPETVGELISFDEDCGTVLVKKEFAGNGMCDGSIFKSWNNFYNHPDQPCYVPEYSYDNNTILSKEPTDDFLTRNDFLAITDGDEKLAGELFEACWWQHATTLCDEWTDDEECEESNNEQ